MSAMDYSGPERRRGGPDRRNVGARHPDSLRERSNLGNGAGGDDAVQPVDGVEEHMGVGGAIALGIFLQKPAAPRRFSHRPFDRIILMTRKRRGAALIAR